MLSFWKSLWLLSVILTTSFEATAQISIVGVIKMDASVKENCPNPDDNFRPRYAVLAIKPLGSISLAPIDCETGRFEFRGFNKKELKGTALHLVSDSSYLVGDDTHIAQILIQKKGALGWGVLSGKTSSVSKRVLSLGQIRWHQASGLILARRVRNIGALVDPLQPVKLYRNGAPIGTPTSGFVRVDRKPLVRRERRNAHDEDRDGVPNVFDVDDDGDGILDQYDRASSTAYPIAEMVSERLIAFVSSIDNLDTPTWCSPRSPTHPANDEDYGLFGCSPNDGVYDLTVFRQNIQNPQISNVMVSTLFRPGREGDNWMDASILPHYEALPDANLVGIWGDYAHTARYFDNLGIPQLTRLPKLARTLSPGKFVANVCAENAPYYLAGQFVFEQNGIVVDRKPFGPLMTLGTSPRLRTRDRNGAGWNAWSGSFWKPHRAVLRYGEFFIPNKSGIIDPPPSKEFIESHQCKNAYRAVGGLRYGIVYAETEAFDIDNYTGFNPFAPDRPIVSCKPEHYTKIPSSFKLSSSEAGSFRGVSLPLIDTGGDAVPDSENSYFSIEVNLQACVEQLAHIPHRPGYVLVPYMVAVGADRPSGSAVAVSRFAY